MKFNFLYSIRFRLLLWFSAILALVMFAFSAFIYFSQARDIRGEALYRLNRKAELVSEALHGVELPPNVLQETDTYVLLNLNGKVLAYQGITNDQEVVSLVQQAEEASQSQNSEGHNYGISWMEERGDPKTDYIFIVAPVSQDSLLILGSPFDPYHLNRRLFTSLLIGNLVMLAIALGGGWWLADRAMRPVHTITQTARTISETDLNRRLNLKTKDELGELANTFDEMLGRLQAAFNRQRQFIADASHELRTPLTIVNLETSRALASRRTLQEYQHALKVIRSENEFMTHLVNDLLVLARLESGQSAIQKEPLDLSDVALEAVERLSVLAERNQVKIATGELPETELHGDRQLLLQMVSNLIENGIKYTVGDDRFVKVETGKDVDSVWVRVSDNGSGIPSEHLPHLFDRFYQVDKARTRNADSSGSGLGLSIVQSIAQMHGGQVNVVNNNGAGTTFEVRFVTQ